jgi:uncharacterized glyoxalase superfamily protein PhnB
MTATLDQLNLVVEDMDATIAFYGRLGLTIDAAPDGQHASSELPNGVRLEFDTSQFAAQWDTGWNGQIGGGPVIGFTFGSREAVDRLYAELTGAGHRGHQPPYDAFWGSRYAIVDDPDGRPVGLMSPVERDRKFWPPSQPPRAVDGPAT